MSEAALPLLVEPAWLETELGAPDLRIVDASWYLPDAGRDGRAEFADAHVPSAVYLDLSSDLADTAAPVRNTIASPRALAQRFAAAGIANDDRVVIYDRLGGYSAGRIWWVLRTVGHANAGLLNGGFSRWHGEGRPTSNTPIVPTPARFDSRPDPSWLAHKADVLRAVRQGDAQIVDARGGRRFRGEGVEPARHKGHIPGALNVPYGDNLHGDPPVFKSADELRRVYEAAGVAFDRPVITTCGSGVTASLSAFALALLGHTELAVYDGSWAEWGNSDDVPIESGP